MKLIITLLLLSVVSNAAMTQWEPTPHAHEVSLDVILDERFPTGWVQLSDLDVFPLDLVLIEVVASYAGATQSFFTSPVAGGFVACNESTGFSQVGVACSDRTMNPNGTVQVLRFDFGHPTQFVLAFEDWLDVDFDNPSDRDFNDFVTIVQKVPQTVGEVPEPSSVLLVGSILVLFGLLKKRK